MSTAITLTGNFMKLVGELLADLRREDLAKIDVELLRLKRTQLTERLDDFRLAAQNAARTEKGNAEHDLISRGLSASTVRQSTLLAIDQFWANENGKAMREYNRAIEEIAILERKTTEQARPLWKRLKSGSMMCFIIIAILLCVGWYWDHWRLTRMLNEHKATVSDVSSSTNTN